MIRCSLLFTLLLLAGTRVQGQVPEALRALAAPDSLRANANSVVVSYDYEYTATSDRTALLRYRHVVTLLNAKDYSEKVYDFYTDDTKITTFEVATYDAFGRETFKARKSDITDRPHSDETSFLDDRWVKYTKAPCSSFPCTIVMEVEKKLSDFAATTGFPHWAPVDRDQSLIEANLTVHMPTGSDLLYEEHLVEGATITSAGDGTTYHWKLENLAAQSAEPLAPSPSETLPYVRTEPAAFRIDGYAGSYRSWQDFGKFMASIMAGRDELPAPLAVEVRETVAGAANEREKIDLLYHLLQERCRYVSIQLGIGGWQPFSAAYVEENRFGDCKALSNYMGAMLREVGIASYPVLIRWDEEPYYSPHESFASSSFNHVVLYVPSQDMYLECTSKYAPTGYLGEDKQDRNVLWITPEGGKLSRTPALIPSEHGHIRTVSLALQDNDQVAFSQQAEYFGAAQELFRSLGAHIGARQDQLDWLHRNAFLPDVSGSEYRYAVASDRPEVSIAYSTVLNNRVRKLGSRRFFSLNPNPIDWIPERDDDRRLPVRYESSRFYVDTVQVTYPAGLEIESGLAGEPIEYTHAAGEYRAEMQVHDGDIYWIRTLKLKPVNLPANEYQGFYQFFADVAKAEHLQLVFRERRTK